MFQSIYHDDYGIQEGPMLLHNFADRAEECLKLSQQTHSQRDRKFFIEMARAWNGTTSEEIREIPASKWTH